MSTFVEHPAWGLLGLGVAILLSGLAWFVERRRRTRLARYAQSALIEQLMPAGALRVASGRPVRLSLAALCAGLALAGPRWGREAEISRRSGVDVVLAVDASLSMMAPDERPNRLERVKQEIRRLRASGPGDRFALLAFAGRSYILTPLTTDGGALELFLDNLDPSVVGQAGSAMGPALRQARELLAESRGGADRAIIIFSDGEAFDDPESIGKEAAAAADAGLHVYTVGFGTSRGSTIPMPGGTIKRDDDGNTVVTRYQPDVLRAVAEAGKGLFVGAQETDKAARLRAGLATLRAERRSVERAAARTPRYQWFLLPAILLLLLDAMWTGATVSAPRRMMPMASAMLAGLLLGGMPRLAHADDLTDAARDFRAGRFAAAVRRLREAVAKGDHRPATLYNLGTALMAADSLAPAIDALERAARGAPPDVRERALFNLGLAQLKRARLGGDSANAAAQQALATYKQVLLGKPNDRDAQWNYELALRLNKEDKASAKPNPSPAAAQPQPDPKENPQQPSGGLQKDQAEQLLDNAARDERDAQGRRQKRNRPDGPPMGKDW